MRRGTLVCLILVFAGTTHAQNNEGFSGRVAFGYLATSGNSESDNLNLSFGGAFEAAPWHHGLEALIVKASANHVDTAEAYSVSWTTRRDLSEVSYVFGFLGWIEDEFSGYEQQVREVLGYGRRFMNTERHVLNGEVGAGFRQAELRDGTSEDEAILRLAADYRWIISDTSDFSQTLAIESGSDNTYTEWVSALRTDVWQNIALVLSYTIKHNSDVPVGTKNRDTFTAISLEYSF